MTFMPPILVLYTNVLTIFNTHTQAETHLLTHTRSHPDTQTQLEQLVHWNKFVEAKHLLFWFNNNLPTYWNSNGTAIEKSLICSSFFSLIIFKRIAKKTKKKNKQITKNKTKSINNKNSTQNSPNWNKKISKKKKFNIQNSTLLELEIWLISNNNIWKPNELP